MSKVVNVGTVSKLYQNLICFLVVNQMYGCGSALDDKDQSNWCLNMFKAELSENPNGLK